MDDTPQKFPLQWPANRPRRKHQDRKSGRFKSNGSEISVALAFERLEAEYNAIGALYPILSSNIELRLDGKPRSNRHVEDPGVCLYFTMDGKPFALACDTYNDVAQNIAALAAHLESTRAIERHGVASASEALEAFSALPPPSGTPSAPRERPWREVFGLPREFGTSAGGIMPEEAKLVLGMRYREAAKKIGTSDEAALKELNIAKAQGEKEINNG